MAREVVDEGDVPDARSLHGSLEWTTRQGRTAHRTSARARTDHPRARAGRGARSAVGETRARRAPLRGPSADVHAAITRRSRDGSGDLRASRRGSLAIRQRGRVGCRLRTSTRGGHAGCPTRAPRRSTVAIQARRWRRRFTHRNEPSKSPGDSASRDARRWRATFTIATGRCSARSSWMVTHRG